MKKINKLIFIFLLSLIILVACGNTSRSKIHQNSSHTTIMKDKMVKDAYKIKIERIDKSFYNKDERLIGSCYYDKPIFKSKNKQLDKKINGFFDKDIQEWNQGTSRFDFYYENNHDNDNRSVQEQLKESIQLFSEIYGENAVLQSPLYSSIETYISYMDENYISILQVNRTNFGGPNGLSYFGTTFNLKNGEIISFTEFVDVSATDFKKTILSYLKSYFKYNKMDIKYMEEFNEIYEYKQNKSFKVLTSEIPIQLNYEYYYDGKNINVIMNFGFVGGRGSVLQWNGKIGNKSQFEFIDP